MQRLNVDATGRDNRRKCNFCKRHNMAFWFMRRNKSYDDKLVHLGSGCECESLLTRPGGSSKFFNRGCRRD